MASLSKKEKIAKAFIESHKDSLSDIDNWNIHFSLTKKEKYTYVYSMMIDGCCGECRGLNAEYDNEGELIKEATEFEIEISGGNIFTFTAV